MWLKESAKWIAGAQLILLTQAWAGPGPSTPYSKKAEALKDSPVFQIFAAADGTKLAYAVMGEPGKLGPIAVVEGKGESVYRYLEFVQEMQARGYGPFYILDHRGQGHSQQVIKNAIHVESFDTYVDDFTRFMDGPVKADLAAKGITRLPHRTRTRRPHAQGLFRLAERSPPRGAASAQSRRTRRYSLHSLQRQLR